MSEQGEPVGKATKAKATGHTCCVWTEDEVPIGTLLYTTPQQHILMADYWKNQYQELKAKAWVGLTDAEIEAVWVDMCGPQRWAMHSVYARKLESKLKEKNT
jgi:hypothetical protein